MTDNPRVRIGKRYKIYLAPRVGEDNRLSSRQQFPAHVQSLSPQQVRSERKAFRAVMITAYHHHRYMAPAADFGNHMIEQVHGFCRRYGPVIYIAGQQNHVRLFFIHQGDKLVFKKPFLFFGKIISI